jgi:hypothetical protein
MVASKYTKSMTLKQVLTGIYRLQDNVYLADIENKVKGHTILLTLLRPFKGMDEDEIENELNTTYEKIITDIQSKTTVSEVVDTLTDRLMPFVVLLEDEKLTDDDLTISGDNTYIDAIIGDNDSERQKKLAQVFFDKIKNSPRETNIPKEDKLNLMNVLTSLKYGDITLDNYDKLPQVEYGLLTVSTNGTLKETKDSGLIGLSEGWIKISERKYQKLYALADKGKGLSVGIGVNERKIITKLTEQLKLVFEGNNLRLFYELTPPPMLKYLGADLVRVTVDTKDEKIKVVESTDLFFNYSLLLNSINSNTHRHLLLPKIDGQGMGMLAEKTNKGYNINQYFAAYIDSSADNGVKAIIHTLNLNSYFTKKELEQHFTGEINTKHYFPLKLINTIKELKEGGKKNDAEIMPDLVEVASDINSIVRLDTESADRLNALLGGASEESKVFISRLKAIERKDTRTTTSQYENIDINYDLRDEEGNLIGMKRLEALEARYEKEKSKLKNEEEIQEAEKRYEKAKAKIESYNPSLPTYAKLAPTFKQQRFEGLGDDLQVEGAILYSAIIDVKDNAQVLQYSRSHDYKGAKTVKQAIKAFYSIAHAFSGEKIDTLVDKLHEQLTEIVGENRVSVKNLDTALDDEVEQLYPLLTEIANELETALTTVKEEYEKGIKNVLKDMATNPRKYKHIDGILERAKAKKLLDW